MHKVGQVVLEGHLQHCVRDGIEHGDAEKTIAEFDIKADVLVAIELVASVLIGETFAAGEVSFIMTLGALLEERTVAKARAGILDPFLGALVHNLGSVAVIINLALLLNFKSE